MAKSYTLCTGIFKSQNPEVCGISELTHQGKDIHVQSNEARNLKIPDRIHAQLTLWTLNYFSFQITQTKAYWQCLAT